MESSSVKSSMRGVAMNPALEALARTDDLLALIGIVILGGVIVSAYGAYWQGKIAKASYKKDFAKGSKEKDNTMIVVAGSVTLAVVIVILYLIIKKRAQEKMQTTQ
jgi:hypothetical protein